MGFLLRREEVLNVEQLRGMLDDSPVRAAQAILIAAKEGVVDAQALLGQILLEGRGIARDEALALRWFRIAAQGGHWMARNMAGRCLEHGWGCAVDEAAAAREYRLAAQAGLNVKRAFSLVCVVRIKKRIAKWWCVIYTPKGEAIRSREVIELLVADGWFEVAVKGSHHQFKHPVKRGRVTVPHPKSEIAKGTVHSIFKSAGLK